jgi:hypothetical protein
MEEIYNKNHNQEHYTLIQGKMWINGDGVGKYWDHLCNSRLAQQQANEMMRV